MTDLGVQPRRILDPPVLAGKTQRASGKMVAGSILANAALRFRDREAFFCADTGRRFTFRQTNDRCNRLAHSLGNLGLRKSSVVAFLCNNRAELPEIYFALAKSGLVGIPLNYRLAPPEIVALMQAMKARVLLFGTRFTAAAAKVRFALPEVEHFVAIGEDRPDWALGYEDLLADASSAEPDEEIDEDDPFYLRWVSVHPRTPQIHDHNRWAKRARGRG